MTATIEYGPVATADGVELDVATYQVVDGDTTWQLQIERDVTGGIDNFPGSFIDFTVYSSADDGTTWVLLGGAGTPGGPLFYVDRQHVQHEYTEATLSGGLELVQGQLLRATVKVTGADGCIMAGTFTIG